MFYEFAKNNKDGLSEDQDNRARGELLYEDIQCHCILDMDETYLSMDGSEGGRGG